jgi:hypothetical protein
MTMANKRRRQPDSEPLESVYGKMRTMPDVRNLLQCSDATIKKLGEQGKLEVVQISERIFRVSDRSLQRLLRDSLRGKQPSSAQESQP